MERSDKQILMSFFSFLALILTAIDVKISNDKIPLHMHESWK